MIVVATITLAIISILSGIFFDEIPILLKKGIYARVTFWEGFNVSLNYTIFQIFVISSIIRFYKKRNKINEYLEKLDIFRKYYRNEPTKVSVETFIIINSLNKLKYKIKDLQGNFFLNGNLKDIKFQKTSFNGCDFTDTYLINIYFYKCFFKGNSFFNCKLNNIDIFSPQNIQNINFINSNIKNSRFRNISSSKFQLNLRNTSMNHVFFESCHLNIQLLEKATINSCSFINCIFENFKGDTSTKINSNKFKNCIFNNEISSNIKNINSTY